MKAFLAVMVTLVLVLLLAWGLATRLGRAVFPAPKLRLIEIREELFHPEVMPYQPYMCEVMYWYEYQSACYYSNVGPYRHISIIRDGVEVTSVSVWLKEPIRIGEIEQALGPAQHERETGIYFLRWPETLVRIYGRNVPLPTLMTRVGWITWEINDNQIGK